jgi:uncharacterized protein
MKKIFEELKREIQPYFVEGGHGFDHVERVFNMAMKLAKEEKADEEVVGISALLHDIARSKEDKDENLCHAEEGAKMAINILKKYNLPENKIKNIVHCIEAHRYSKGIKPETKESEIIQDADRLDALGAIIVARVFTRNGEQKSPMHQPGRKPDKNYHGQVTTAINHFYEKIFKLKPEEFNTKTAKNIAKKRYKFTKDFVDRFLEEWDGKI